MKFSVAAVALAAAGASAGYAGNVTVITEIVDKYTTYCPEPTEITQGDKTYTITEPGTVTITDCPCTVTKPVTTSTEVVCHTCVAPPPVDMPSTTPEVHPPPAPEAPEEPAPPAETPDVPPPTGGAAQAAILSGAGLAGVVGLAAFIL